MDGLAGTCTTCALPLDLHALPRGHVGAHGRPSCFAQCCNWNRKRVHEAWVPRPLSLSRNVAGVGLIRMRRAESPPRTKLNYCKPKGLCLGQCWRGARGLQT